MCSFHRYLLVCLNNARLSSKRESANIFARLRVKVYEFQRCCRRMTTCYVLFLAGDHILGFTFEFWVYNVTIWIYMVVKNTPTSHLNLHENQWLAEITSLSVNGN